MPALSGIAQTLTGTIRERSSNDAIPYATVSLLRSDSTMVTGNISNDLGHFQLQAAKGTYILQVSYVGYQTVCRDVQVDKSKVAIGDIFLAEESTAIAEVEIKADRPLIQRQMDKLVMNVSNGPFSVGFTSEEILKKAPGVTVDKDGNVKVNGKAVSVYIDGRPSYLSGEQLTAMLQGTDAAMIEKIEIIMHPSAKYDASGEGGAIINIKLKKDKNKGTNGSLSATYGGMYFKQPGQYFQNERFSFSLNHRAQHTYTAFSLTQSYNTRGGLSQNYSQQPFASDTLRTTTESASSRANQWYNVKLSNDWYIDDRNTLGFILRVPIWINNSTQPANRNHSVVRLAEDTVQYSCTEGTERAGAPTYTANVNYTHVFNDSLSRELTIDATYNRSNHSSETKHTNTIFCNDDAIVPRIPDRLNVSTRQVTDRVVAKADFQTAFWRTGMIECGGKWQMNRTANDMNTDSVMPSYSTTTHTAYVYSEHIAAAYITLSKQFGEHWNTKVGLRGELTAYKGLYERASEQREVASKPYFNLFPSAFVGYTPTQKWSLSITYDRSIWRPGVWYLNPFVEYRSAHEYSVGNPELKPEFSNNLDLDVGWSKYITLNFTFSHTSGTITNRPEIMDNGDKKVTPVNYGTEYSFGPSLSLSEIPVVPKFKTNDQGKKELDGAWLTLTANVGLYDNISIADANVDSNYGTKSSLHCFYYGALTAYLPKDWQIGTDVWGSTPSASGYDRWMGGFSWSGSVKKRWIEHGLTLSLNVNDFLRSSVWRGESVGLQDGYSSSYIYTAHAQRVSIGLTWNFGKNQQHKYRNVGDSGEDGGQKSTSPAAM